MKKKYYLLFRITILLLEFLEDQMNHKNDSDDGDEFYDADGI